MSKPESATPLDVSDWVKKLVRDELLQTRAYQVADASGLVKLDAMENPYPLPQELKSKWLASLGDVMLNRYPDPHPRNLKESLYRVMGIDSQFAMLFGNGSDEIIQMLCMAVRGNEPVVLAPTPTFVMYDVIARACRLKFAGVPLTDDFALDAEAMLAAIHEQQPALTFIAYPNNPTGNLFDTDAITAIVEASPGLVILDEAYYIFARHDAMAILSRYPNVLVMRTLSKIGLAGLRVGMLFGAPAWIGEIDKIRLPYNINVLSQHSAAFLLNHWQIIEDQARAIINERQKLQQALADLAPLKVYPSEANFILFRVSPGRGREVFEGVKEQGVLIKAMPEHGFLKDCLRVTIGTPDENRQFLQALQHVLKVKEA